MTAGYDLDHVALAATDTSDALRFLTGALGGRVIFGGQSIGFRPMQVWVGTDDGDGMPVELLEPWAVDRTTSWPGSWPGTAPARTTSRSRWPASTARSNGCAAPDSTRSTSTSRIRSGRKRSSCRARRTERSCSSRSRTVIPRPAPSSSRTSPTHGPNQHPRWWSDPSPADGPPARLRRVVLRTPVLTTAVEFFAGILEGEIEHETDAHVDLVWSRGRGSVSSTAPTRPPASTGWRSKASAKSAR